MIKSWGENLELFSDPQWRIEKISIKQGGECSVHYHRTKFNLFLWLAGELVINMWENDQFCYVRLNKNNTIVLIAPNVIHHFVATEDSFALEIYWPAEYTELICQDDIIRLEGVEICPIL